MVDDAPADIVLVTLAFDVGAIDSPATQRLVAVLSNYVVMSRQHPGCRNIDLCTSVTTLGRFVIIEKWDSLASQRAHFDSPEMVEMAQACVGLLLHPPQIDLLEGLSAHDLN